MGGGSRVATTIASSPMSESSKSESRELELELIVRVVVNLNYEPSGWTDKVEARNVSRNATRKFDVSPKSWTLRNPPHDPEVDNAAVLNSTLGCPTLSSRVLHFKQKETPKW